jgi:hypothetical protein
LITASWNVVTVYANVGSDFPAFHKVVLELKNTLEEFEKSFALPHTQVAKSRRETTNSKTGGGGSGISTPASGTPGTPPVPTARSSTSEVSLMHDIGAAEDPKDPEERDSRKSAPPHLEANEGVQEDNVKQGDRQDDHPSSPDHRRAHSLTRPAANYTGTSPLAIQHPTAYKGPPSVRSTHHAPGADLMRKRQEYTASLAKMNRRVEESAAAGQGDRGSGEYPSLLAKMNRRVEESAAAGQGERGSEEQDEVDDFWGRTKARAAGRGVAVPKTLGKAPVAPMLGTTRREGGDGGEASRGARKEW